MFVCSASITWSNELIVNDSCSEFNNPKPLSNVNKMSDVKNLHVGHLQPLSDVKLSHVEHLKFPSACLNFR